MADPVVLHALFDEYPITRALRAGEVNSPLIRFDFAGHKPANKGFKPMVRDLAFHAGELAIVTFLQARAHGKPLVLLPATVMGRFQHHCVAYNPERGVLSPTSLAGTRIGVRAYTQTTGMWVRGILQHQFGADLKQVTWVTFEDAHVAEYRNPSNVVIETAKRSLTDMLLAGEVDVAILGDVPDDPRLRTLIRDPAAAAGAWHAQTGAITVNHLAVVREDLCQSRPDVVRELFRCLKASKAAADLQQEPDMHPFGLEALRPALELAIDLSREQGLLSRKLAVEDLFDPATIALS